MARLKEFDVDQALDQAMHVFWSQGYTVTSLSDLTSAMDISKSSFYATFGSKHDLFISTIERYVASVTSQIVDAAKMDAPARKIIRALFDRAVERMLKPESRRGCYLNNCAIEVSRTDVDAADAVAHGLEIMEGAFLELVQRGQREGGIGVHHDARAVARYLTATVNGILVLGKAKPDADRLYDVADVAMSALD